MRRFLILAAFLLMPVLFSGSAHAGCIPGVGSLPCIGGAVLESLDSFLGEPTTGRCGRGSHGTVDMYGNKGCASGRGAMAKHAREAAQKPGTVFACPMGSIMARNDRGRNFCKDVPGALHPHR